LELPGTLDEQARLFFTKAREDPTWAQESLTPFIEFQKDRVTGGEICTSTVSNYYKAIKVFSIMNDLVLNWKKIS
jgi:hypothetical protein